MSEFRRVHMFRLLSSRYAIHVPIFQTDVTRTIGPSNVKLNRLLLFFVTAIVRVIRSKFPQGREAALNPIEVGSIRGRPVELYLVPTSEPVSKDFSVGRRHLGAREAKHKEYPFGRVGPVRAGSPDGDRN